MRLYLMSSFDCVEVTTPSSRRRVDGVEDDRSARRARFSRSKPRRRLPEQRARAPRVEADPPVVEVPAIRTKSFQEAHDAAVRLDVERREEVRHATRRDPERGEVFGDVAAHAPIGGSGRPRQGHAAGLSSCAF